MDKKQATDYIESMKRSVHTNSDIAKRNIFNSTEGIIRNMLGGEFTIPADPDALKDGIRIKSVPFVPEKQKDQVFHRLEFKTVPVFPERKPMKLTVEQIGLKEALDIFGEAVYAAEREIEEN